jgi:hypothetical protein
MGPFMGFFWFAAKGHTITHPAIVWNSSELTKRRWKPKYSTYRTRRKVKKPPTNMKTWQKLDIKITASESEVYWHSLSACCENCTQGQRQVIGSDVESVQRCYTQAVDCMQTVQRQWNAGCKTTPFNKWKARFSKNTVVVKFILFLLLGSPVFGGEMLNSAW